MPRATTWPASFSSLPFRAPPARRLAATRSMRHCVRRNPPPIVPRGERASPSATATCGSRPHGFTPHYVTAAGRTNLRNQDLVRRAPAMPAYNRIQPRSARSLQTPMYPRGCFRLSAPIGSCVWSQTTLALIRTRTVIGRRGNSFRWLIAQRRPTGSRRSSAVPIRRAVAADTMTRRMLLCATEFHIPTHAARQPEYTILPLVWCRAMPP
jgi:hypothetical protein